MHPRAGAYHTSGISIGIDATSGVLTQESIAGSLRIIAQPIEDLAYETQSDTSMVAMSSHPSRYQGVVHLMIDDPTKVDTLGSIAPQDPLMGVEFPPAARPRFWLISSM